MFGIRFELKRKIIINNEAIIYIIITIRDLFSIIVREQSSIKF